MTRPSALRFMAVLPIVLWALGMSIADILGLFFHVLMVVGGLMIFVCGLSYVFAVLFGEGERA